MIGKGNTGPNPPQLSAEFKARRWNENSVEQLKKELEETIANDPHVSSESAVIVHPEASGNEVKKVTLQGHVQNDAERQRVRQIVGVNTHDEIHIENDVMIKQ
ncbi:MAG: hypothetical protein ACLFP4_09565 [Spirochaetales bacterium]